MAAGPVGDDDNRLAAQGNPHATTNPPAFCMELFGDGDEFPDQPTSYQQRPSST